jgi:hypothetical protein
MRKDDHIIFESYKKKSGLHFGMSDAEYNKMEEEREKKEHKQFKKDYKKVFGRGKSEDEESHDECKYAKEGCDCDECAECRANQKSEDSEQSDDPMARIEAKRKGRKNIGSVRSKSEDSEWDDEERRGDANGRWSDKRTGRSHRDDQGDDEDAESYGIEGKIKAALQEVESVGYTGDHIDPSEVAKLVVGHQGDWGDSYESLVQALSHVIEAYYSKGLQDS